MISMPVVISKCSREVVIEDPPPPEANPVARHVLFHALNDRAPLRPSKTTDVLQKSMRKRKLSRLEDVHPPQSVNGTKKGTSTRHSKEKLINDANKLPVNDFKNLYIKDETLHYAAESDDSSQDFFIDFKSSGQLTEDELNECFNLIKSTSRQDYEGSSWGWHPKRKKREMKEDEMRYLLVRSADKPSKSGSTALDPVQGFTSFMLTHDSNPSMPVLYIYEIHLEKPLRKLRLGAHLMDIVETIAENVRVNKVMLTCFLTNERARGFYEIRGYARDVCSPEDRTTRGKVIKTDYVIMSKAVSEAG